MVAAVTSGEVADQLVEGATEAQGLAWAAWNLRDDLYDDPTIPDLSARIVLAVLAETAGRALPACAVTRAAAEAAVAAISYRHWKFVIEDGPIGLRVRVIATVGDSRAGVGTFTLSRSADVHGRDVAAAALAAVLQVERHEAMERFLVDGERVFDPHSPPAGFVAEDVVRRG